mmetsp:Transcript_24662/g.69360  ORF Transcript_24662/g.69360 Transcript_24662/m.69360 type:complete len:423 (-) Transcript_24662:57-1325(-)
MLFWLAMSCAISMRSPAEGRAAVYFPAGAPVPPGVGGPLLSLTGEYDPSHDDPCSMMSLMWGWATSSCTTWSESAIGGLSSSAAVFPRLLFAGSRSGGGIFSASLACCCDALWSASCFSRSASTSAACSTRCRFLMTGGRVCCPLMTSSTFPSSWRWNSSRLMLANGVDFSSQRRIRSVCSDIRTTSAISSAVHLCPWWKAAMSRAAPQRPFGRRPSQIQWRRMSRISRFAVSWMVRRRLPSLSFLANRSMKSEGSMTGTLTMTSGSPTRRCTSFMYTLARVFTDLSPSSSEKSMRSFGSRLRLHSRYKHAAATRRELRPWVKFSLTANWNIRQPASLISSPSDNLWTILVMVTSVFLLSSWLGCLRCPHAATRPLEHSTNRSSDTRFFSSRSSPQAPQYDRRLSWLISHEPQYTQRCAASI